ncbi:hypothetical protein WN51_10300 [Melipona quadrifasciata]|uniref:Ig-like domain-containing protein n=1 Tax=Melipona quadrifasciata TaxID=166423 RepID=A0A0M9A4R3_9HYME|nr:hypothetical protein WN51_10300 [Melipona quadrifasciata]
MGGGFPPPLPPNGRFNKVQPCQALFEQHTDEDEGARFRYLRIWKCRNFRNIRIQIRTLGIWKLRKIKICESEGLIEQSRLSINLLNIVVDILYLSKKSNTRPSTPRIYSSTSALIVRIKNRSCFSSRAGKKHEEMMITGRPGRLLSPRGLDLAEEIPEFGNEANPPAGDSSNQVNGEESILKTSCSPMSSVPRVEIVDEHGATAGDKFYKAGSTIELKCVVSNIPQPTGYVTWRHGSRTLNYDTTRGGISYYAANVTLSLMIDNYDGMMLQYCYFNCRIVSELYNSIVK